MFIFVKMKRLLYFALIFFPLVFHAEKSSAQLNVFIEKAISTFSRITGSTGYDTTYIAPPARPWMVASFAQSTGFDVYNSNTLSGIGYQSFRSSRTRYFSGVNASYKGFGLEVGFNPQKVFQNKKFNEKVFNLNYYTNRFCIDAMYNYSPSIAGTLKMNGEWTSLPENILEQKSLLISSYYIFNNKQFSYPAAFNQGFIQKRSAGSPLAIMLFCRKRFNINPWEALDSHYTESKLLTFCVGAGYGYNFVTPHIWLIHLSGIPAVSVLSVTGSTLDDVETNRRPYLNAMLTQRFSVVKYLANDHLYFNISAYGIGLLALKDLRFSYAQMVWDTRFTIGLLF